MAACDAPAAAAGGGGGGGMPVFNDGVQRIFECLVPLPSIMPIGRLVVGGGGGWGCLRQTLYPPLWVVLLICCVG